MSPEIQAFTNAIAIALAHMGLTMVLLFVGATVYALITPHKEIQLIQEGNRAAALSFGGMIVALALPLALSLAGSTTLAEVGLWGVMSVAVQLLIFRLTDMLLAGLPERIREGEMAAATLLVSAKLATAMILAAAFAG
jgi:putative membrane protein